MGTKITFTKLVTPLESIQVDFGDGEGLKDYNTNRYSPIFPHRN